MTSRLHPWRPRRAISRQDRWRGRTGQRRRLPHVSDFVSYGAWSHTTAMSGRETLEAILQDVVVRLGADVYGLKGVGGRVNLGLVHHAPVQCQLAQCLFCGPTHRLIRSGRGFPMAFFKAPVMVKAAPILRPSPSIPQFNSQRRSLNLYLPERRLMPALSAGIVVWCENRPSITIV